MPPKADTLPEPWASFLHELDEFPQKGWIFIVSAASL
jgi:hypothetical protein